MQASARNSLFSATEGPYNTGTRRAFEMNFGRVQCPTAMRSALARYPAAPVRCRETAGAFGERLLIFSEKQTL